jgi:hypothetical protein
MLRERCMRLSVLTANRVLYGISRLGEEMTQEASQKRTSLPVIKYLYTYYTSTSILIQSAGTSTGIYRLTSLFQDAYLIRYHDSIFSALKMSFSTEWDDVRNILKEVKSFSSLGYLWLCNSLYRTIPASCYFCCGNAYIVKIPEN